MGIQALQKFIETNCPGACVPVDLLKIARSVSVARRRPGGPKSTSSNKLCLVVDGECCLDRLYGGFFSDWVCGGQWNRMVQFLAVLIQTIQHNNMELAVFFNGSLESQRMDEWIKQQQNERKKINQVLKHVNTKGTPPPKVWWSPPVCLTTCLRMALRHLNITVLCTMDDHRQEVIAYCRENSFHGLMAEDAEYAIFDPPRYFSSEQLKLTYKGSLETKEFILDEVAKGLDLHPNRFCVFAALLGNYLLTEEDLMDFYKTICPEAKSKQLIPSDVLIRAVCNFVRSLPSIDNLDAISSQVFGTSSASTDERVQKFKQCVQYYLNGTKDGFLRYRPSNNARRFEPGHYPPSTPRIFNPQPQVSSSNVPATANNSGVTPSGGQQQTPNANNNVASTPTDNGVSGATATPASTITDNGSECVVPNNGDVANALPSVDPARFASETVESELSSLTAYQEATSAYMVSTPQIVIEPPAMQPQEQNPESYKEVTSTSVTPTDEPEDEPFDGISDGQASAAVSGTASTWTTNGSSSAPSASAASANPMPQTQTSLQQQQEKPNPQQTQRMPLTKPGMTPGRNNGLNAGINHQNNGVHSQMPSVPPEVMRTASERHQKGLMSPWIYQILSQGEIKIPLSIEEESPKELPPAALLYRPVRQMVYAILFNIHHLQFLAKQRAELNGGKEAEKLAEVVVKEWVWTKSNTYWMAEAVKAVPLNWAVPTVQRLWFGAALDDKKRRLRAFLTCLRSDTPLMLNTSYVPQHLLIMCCVLRYIISCTERRILRKQELDAFLAQSVSPQLMDAQYMQNMQLLMITPRGVQLAALFMRGVEAALFANDACGAPVPWLMCCPWLFFDGKLFHHKLIKANGAKNLIEICDGQIDQVAKVERMRQAVLEGLKVEFARPPFALIAQNRMAGGNNSTGMSGGYPPQHPPPLMPPHHHQHHHHQMMSNAVPPPMGFGRGRARGLIPPPPDANRNVGGRRGMLARGGQLEIAGVVVGSWGPNFGAGGRGRSMQVAPQVTSVGGYRRYGGGGNVATGNAGGNYGRGGGYPAYGVRRIQTRLRRVSPQYSVNQKKGKTQQQRKVPPSIKSPRLICADDEDEDKALAGSGRGCTVQLGKNRTVPVSQFVHGISGGGDAIAATNGETGNDESVTSPKPSIASKDPTAQQNGQFDDAVTPSSEPPLKTVIMKKVTPSPQSGGDTGTPTSIAATNGSKLHDPEDADADDEAEIEVEDVSVVSSPVIVDVAVVPP